MKIKYLLFAYNEQAFIVDKYKEEKFEKYVRLDWSTMDINTPYLKPYHIEVQEITDQTSYIPFARPKEDDFFNL